MDLILHRPIQKSRTAVENDFSKFWETLEAMVAGNINCETKLGAQYST